MLKEFNFFGILKKIPRIGVFHTLNRGFSKNFIYCYLNFLCLHTAHLHLKKLFPYCLLCFFLRIFESQNFIQILQSRFTNSKWSHALVLSKLWIKHTKILPFRLFLKSIELIIVAGFFLIVLKVFFIISHKRC